MHLFSRASVTCFPSCGIFLLMVATLQILLIITCHVYLIVKISYLSPVFKRSYELIFRGSVPCYIATSLFIDCKNFIDVCIQFKKDCVYPHHFSIRDTCLRNFFDLRDRVCVLVTTYFLTAVNISVIYDGMRCLV